MGRFAVGFASAWVLALFADGAVSAGIAIRPVTHVRGEVHRIIAAAPGSVTLLDQNDDDSGVATESSFFTDDFYQYSAYGADDFSVPVGHRWKITQVELAGKYEQGDGPASSENVFFYRNKNGLPGRLLMECDNLLGSDNYGSFAIKLPKSCQVALKGGNTYWISVVSNIDFNESGEWAWETRNSQNGNPAAWENPLGGFGVCPTWDVLTSCLGDGGEGPDFMFTLKGRDVTQ